MAMNKNDVKKIVSKYPTDRLGPGSLLTLSSQTSGVRQNMANHQIGHAVNIIDPDVAKVSTGFEAVIGQFSGMLARAEDDEVVVHKMVKNDYFYVLLTYRKSTKTYNVICRKEIEEQSEGFATKYKNKYIDSLEEGDTIKKDDIIYKSEAFDKNLNYCLGKNLNTLHMISVDCLEDQIQLMNGAENMMNTYMYDTVYINLHENEVLLNLYGDEDEYLPLPKIGKKVHRGVLGAVRSINNTSSLFTLKKKNLSKVIFGDRVLYGEGKVIDVDIYYNKDMSKLSEDESNSYINDLYLNQLAYYREIYEVLTRIIENADDEGHKYTSELSILYKEAKTYLDASAYYEKDGIIKNMLIVVKLLYVSPLVNGSKLVGRSGNKGVVKIMPKESWYTTADSGMKIHAVFDALGIVGRLNPSVLTEHQLNASALSAEERIRNAETTKEKYKILTELYDLVNPEAGKHFKKMYREFTSDQKDIYMTKVGRNGIILLQDPVECCNIADHEIISKAFPPRYEKIKFADGTTSIKKVIVAPQYFYRLKQDPIDKYSARARGMINPLYLLPTKSALKKHNLSPVSDIPVRIGEFETDVLLLCNEPNAIADYMAENSTSSSAKNVLADQYINSEMELDDIDIGVKKNREIVDAYLEVLSSEIVFEYEE